MCVRNEKISCLMPIFLNLKAIHLFSSSIQPQHTVSLLVPLSSKPCSALQWLWPTNTQNPNVGLRGELLMLKQPEDAFVVEVKFNFLFSRRLRQKYVFQQGKGLCSLYCVVQYLCGSKQQCYLEEKRKRNHSDA